MEGGTIIGDIRGVFGRHLKAWRMVLQNKSRKNIPPQERAILLKDGDVPIQTINVARSPIQSYIIKAIKIGNFLTRFKGKRHDDLFHLYLIVRLENGKIYKMEKNQEFNIEPYKPHKMEQRMNIPTPQNTTMNTLMSNAIAKYGENLLFYDPVKNNCQKFIIDLFNASNINISDEQSRRIMIDASGITSGTLSFLGRQVTTLANKIGLLKEGYGIDDIDDETSYIVFLD